MSSDTWDEMGRKSDDMGRDGTKMGRESGDMGRKKETASYRLLLYIL